MAAAALAAKTALAQIVLRENVASVFDVKINTFLKWSVGVHLGVDGLMSWWVEKLILHMIRFNLSTLHK